MPVKPKYQQLEFIPTALNPAQQRQTEGREGWTDTATQPAPAEKIVSRFGTDSSK
ncbi:hypothetical protein [Leptolyngbya ohadii]|uniref:hypothetical protein n=1 Tax=Leptolyngbya ohadii TaxID=1962290 RepID=UPI0015C5B740|nr:hypothetical protein [Leptolyngbya ohadii]